MFQSSFNAKPRLIPLESFSQALPKEQLLPLNKFTPFGGEQLLSAERARIPTMKCMLE